MVLRDRFFVRSFMSVFRVRACVQECFGVWVDGARRGIDWISWEVTAEWWWWKTVLMSPFGVASKFETGG